LAFLVVLAALAVYVGYLVVKPLLSAILLAAVLAVLASPMMKRYEKLLRGRRSLAALAAVLTIIFLILLPVAILLSLLTVESLALYDKAATFIQSGGLQEMATNSTVAKARASIEHYLAVLGGSQVDLKVKAAEAVQKLSGFFIATGQSLAANVASSAGQLLVTLFVLYYLFIDGRGMVEQVVSTSPLPEARIRTLVRRFEDVARASFIGTFGVAVVQGVLGGIAFAIVGFQPIFWGIMIAFFSLIPVVGTAIIWAPAGILLLIQGRFLAGLFLLAWGAVVVGSADNFLRPYLMKGKAGLHPLVIFLSVIGGIPFFGMLGIVFGPLVAATALTLVGMVGEEFGQGDSTHR
jgi:predicted PurR-regulated permease PerM